MKRIIPYLFLLMLCGNVQGQEIPKPEIGDLIVNPDGSRGIVFWINPEEIMGYMLNLIQQGKAVWSPDRVVVPTLPEIGGTVAQLNDTNGYSNTLAIRNYYDCSVNPDIAACKVDIDNGWFLPSAGIANYLYMAYRYIRPKLVEYGGDTAFEGAGDIYGSTFAYGGVIWTSSQNHKEYAHVLDFSNGNLRGSTKNSYDYPSYVCSVKRFSILPEFSYDTTLSYRWNTGDSATRLSAKPLHDSLFSVTAISKSGCFDIASRQIFVSDAVPRTVYDTVCAGYAYAANGFTLPSDSCLTAGDFSYHRVLQNEDCDVDVTLHLSVMPEASSLVVDSFCEGRSYLYNGVVYDDSGSYVQFLTSASGCDSTLSLKLSLKRGSESTIYSEGCGSYFWNNRYFYKSGTYS
ncbi:MAG: hypothetical protein LBR45_00460, partial [Bacteroidales bacterium]|nr:hypothetical protein [Bacteroidales bacterium]